MKRYIVMPGKVKKEAIQEKLEGLEAKFMDMEPVPGFAVEFTGSADELYKLLEYKPQDVAIHQVVAHNLPDPRYRNKN